MGVNGAWQVPTFSWYISLDEVAEPLSTPLCLVHREEGGQGGQQRDEGCGRLDGNMSGCVLGGQGVIRLEAGGGEVLSGGGGGGGAKYGVRVKIQRCLETVDRGHGKSQGSSTGGTWREKI